MTDPEHFIFLNDESITRTSGPNYNNSCIDISIASASLTLKCYWRVEEDNWRSDHYPITIELGIKLESLPKNQYKYNTKKIDWKEFQKFLDERVGNLIQ